MGEMTQVDAGTPNGPLPQDSPWPIHSAPFIGTALLALMVGLVIWRAATRQASTLAEVLVGVIGLLALLSPLVDNFSVEGLGVKASAKLMNVDQTAEQNGILLGKLDVRLTALEKSLTQAKIMEGGRDAGREGEVAKGLVTLIYFTDKRLSDASKIRDALIQKGFPASIVATDFSEIKNRLPADSVRLLYTVTGKDGVEVVKLVAEAVAGADRVEKDQSPSRLKTGQIQVWLF